VTCKEVNTNSNTFIFTINIQKNFIDFFFPAENEYSIAIKDPPPLKENNVGIEFVILLLVIGYWLLVIFLNLSFGFYKVLKRKNRKKKILELIKSCIK
jgi:hypothetical protein